MPIMTPFECSHAGELWVGLGAVVILYAFCTLNRLTVCILHTE